MKLIILFLAIILPSCCLAQQYTDLSSLLESIKNNEASRNQRINAYLKNKKQLESFTSDEGSHYLLIDVDAKGNPVLRSALNVNAAITTGASKLQSGTVGLLLEGKNMTIGVWDDGKIKDHIELDNRVISNEGDSFADHATHVTGTLIAKGINPSAKGMAPNATVTARYFDNDDIEIASVAKPDQTSLLFSSHSYGQVTGWYRVNGIWTWAGDPAISQNEDFKFGFYGDRAQLLDQIAFLAPYYSIIWAAGNDRAEPGDGTRPADCNSGTGYDCIIPDATGKNIITVGAIDRVFNYNGPGSVQMSSFSSWGPADDGRIKPDLVGDGINLFSLSAGGVNGYMTLSGTSMATPNVAGSLSLLQELYSKLHGGNFMRAATLKALAIHTAKEAGDFPGPDYRFGWGLLDVEAAANLLMHQDGIETRIEELVLKDGEFKEWILSPEANQKIKVTIAWTDPASVPVMDQLDPSNIMLVNDLDIKIVDETGNTFLPWTLNPGNLSQAAAKGNNIRDNAERLDIDLPVAKPYRLIVSHKGKLVNSEQYFSLILTYQSTVSQSQTYYWIGDTGDWNDPSHWSLTSGGMTTSKIPSNNDHVVIDENSFDGLGLNQINFSQDHAINSMVWICSKASGLSMNNKNLTVSKSLLIASDDFRSFTNGSILLNSNSEGRVNFTVNNIPLLDFTINAGDWSLMGNATINGLNLNQGKLKLTSAKLKLKNLISNTDQMRELSASNSSIELTESSSMLKTNLLLNADGSSLIVKDHQVTLDWNGIYWLGNLVINNGSVILKGDNAVGTIDLTGNIELMGSNKIQALLVNPGADILLASGTEQVIDDVDIKTNSLLPVKIHSALNSSVNISVHKKFCFDFIHVSNVESKGTGLINLGENSVLNNAIGWRSQKCEEILFADFEVSFPCVDGITNFLDKSSGLPQQWEWTFPGAIKKASRNADFTFKEDGKHFVTLTINNGSITNSYQAEITIVGNSLASNQIIVGSENMYSFNQATSYQWYRNGALLLNETKRMYPYKGEEGTYFAITYDERCNRVSDAIVITNTAENIESEIRIYPNPADEELVIELKNEDIRILMISDLMGKVLTEQKLNQSKIVIPTKDFPSGVYIVETTILNAKHQNKILIRH
jgi:Subtilase family/Secretion system C-terminal sorting domain